MSQPFSGGDIKKKVKHVWNFHWNTQRPLLSVSKLLTIQNWWEVWQVVLFYISHTFRFVCRSSQSLDLSVEVANQNFREYLYHKLPKSLKLKENKNRLLSQIKVDSFMSLFFCMPPRRRVGGHINLLLSIRSSICSSVFPFCPDIDTWFVRLSPPTVLDLQL
jgi:hypothetical protein